MARARVRIGSQLVNSTGRRRGIGATYEFRRLVGRRTTNYKQQPQKQECITRTDREDNLANPPVRWTRCISSLGRRRICARSGHSHASMAVFQDDGGCQPAQAGEKDFSLLTPSIFIRIGAPKTADRIARD